jgi:L-threonylcarbamoyladenylate synthase
MKKTLVLKVSPLRPDMKKIRLAARFIREGGLVSFPTETVYGLGANALNTEAVLALFKAKMRPLDNPPIVHVGNLEDVYKLAKKVPERAKFLMKKFWPGPLTMIFYRSDIVPEVTVAHLDTIAVRMPNHPVALKLIKESGCPIAAPSANLAGRPSPTTAQHVLEDLNGRIDVILDAGPTSIGVESTVLDLTVDPPQILRPGGLTYEALNEVLGKVTLHPVAIAQEELPVNRARSPGMKHKHYAPKAELIVVEGEPSLVASKIMELAGSLKKVGCKIGVLAASETVGVYKADVVKCFGSRDNLAVVANNLFRLLREFDLEGVDVIISEGVPAKGLGLAVMNRLRKASGYNIVRV